MKNYIKGIITGILISVLLFAIPVLAANIDAVLNGIRINVNGVDELQWGEEIALSDGTSAPSSILSNGTTYLPLRKIGDLLGEKIYWNGDSNTVYVTGSQSNKEIVAEKADSYGNVWKYYTFEDDNEKTYLGVSDETRGYERVYRIMGEVNVTDDAIYFVRLIYESKYQMSGGSYAYGGGEFYCIKFANDVDSQDGEATGSVGNYICKAVTDGEYIYCSTYSPGNAPKGIVVAYNCATGETSQYSSAYTYFFGLSVLESDSEHAVLGNSSVNTMHDIVSSSKQLYFDKTTNTFTDSSSEE